MTELDTARAIASGDAPSPSDMGGFVLWAIRITSTGRAERTARREVVYRDPGLWLNPETLARCNGLSVLIEHPSGALNSAEYADRSVGAVLYPYIADESGIENQTGPDVWAIARIYDIATNRLLTDRTLSTSPAVIFRPSDGNTTVDTGNGHHLLLEGVPSLIDHVAIVTNGVWDGDAGPTGIRNDLKQEQTDMTEANPDPVARAEQPNTDRADAEYPGQPLDKILSHLDDIRKRMDSLEGAEKKRQDAARKRQDAMRRKLDGADDPDAEGQMDGEAHPEAEAEPARRGTPRRVAADADTERKEAGEKAAVQARADAVAMAHGSRAAPPMAGEKTLAYRVRMARQFQRFTKGGFDKIDVEGLKGTTAFDAVEDKIYADAQWAAEHEPEIHPGVLREIIRVDPQTGQRVSTFVGDHTFIHAMKRPSRRVVGFNTKSVA